MFVPRSTHHGGPPAPPPVGLPQPDVAAGSKEKAPSGKVKPISRKQAASASKLPSNQTWTIEVRKYGQTGSVQDEKTIRQTLQIIPIAKVLNGADGMWQGDVMVLHALPKTPGPVKRDHQDRAVVPSSPPAGACRIFELPDNDGHGGLPYRLEPLFFQPMGVDPEGNTVMFSQRLYAFSSTLSGKSRFLALMARDWINRYQPETGRVILFSGIKDDPNYTTLIPPAKLKRVADLDDTFGSAYDEGAESERAPLRDLSKLRDTFCIFDDTHLLPSVKAHRATQALADRLFRGGRHLNVTVGITAQTGLRGHASMTLLNNAFLIWANPRSASRHQVASFLKNYLKLPPRATAQCALGVEELVNQPTSFLLISRVPPIFVLWEQGCLLL